jgi:DNA uptake protein ComE-like DNA-binding protein
VNRNRAIAVVLAAAGALGFFAWRRAPVAPVALDCDGGVPRVGADGVVACSGAELPPGQALTLKQKFDCNTASEADLALVVGADAARKLFAARDAGFSSWEQIDAVAGMGGERLLRLQAACEIRLGDGGVW